jgi:hypothetical protein
MALSRGLVRPWVVLSVCWVVGIGAFTWYTLLVDDCAVVAVEKHPSFDGMPGQATAALQPNSKPPKPKFIPDERCAGEHIAHIKPGAVLAVARPLVVLSIH